MKERSIIFKAVIIRGTILQIFVLFFLIGNVLAQEYFQLTQYLYSAHAINPAFSGIEDLVNTNIGVRTQWTSIAESPTTFYAGFNGSISGLKNTLSDQRTLRTSVPRYYNKLQNQPGSIQHGVGFYLFQDAFGPYRETSGYLTYAFSYQINKNYKIATGLSLEVSNQRFRENDVSLYNPDQDIVYQQYVDGPGNISHLNLNGGVALYGNNLFIGYSIHHFARARISQDNFTEAGVNGLYHFILAGINIPMGPEWMFQPSTLLKVNSENKSVIDVAGKLKYRELIWGGLSYRHEDAIGFLLGFIIDEKIFVNYSYDFHTNSIRKYSSGSHELVLGYRVFSDRSSKPFLW
jgi:type IX secretion system PorP/SprF family membrane protein